MKIVIELIIKIFHWKYNLNLFTGDSWTRQWLGLHPHQCQQGLLWQGIATQSMHANVIEVRDKWNLRPIWNLIIFLLLFRNEIEAVDFKNSEKARLAINKWVEEKTLVWIFSWLSKNSMSYRPLQQDITPPTQPPGSPKIQNLSRSLDKKLGVTKYAFALFDKMSCLIFAPQVQGWGAAK